jgi:hypothetical protein
MRNASMTSTGRGAFYGLMAALLFGLSAPVSKLLLPGVGFVMLASLLYLGRDSASLRSRSFAGSSAKPLFAAPIGHHSPASSSPAASSARSCCCTACRASPASLDPCF